MGHTPEVWGSSCVNGPNTRAWEQQEWNTTKKQKKSGVSMERSKAITKTKSYSHDGISLPNQNTILINIISSYFIRYGKIQWNSINKKMDLNNRKMKNDPPSPDRDVWRVLKCVRDEMFKEFGESNTICFNGHSYEWKWAKKSNSEPGSRLSYHMIVFFNTRQCRQSIGWGRIEKDWQVGWISVEMNDESRGKRDRPSYIRNWMNGVKVGLDEWCKGGLRWMV